MRSSSAPSRATTVRTIGRRFVSPFHTDEYTDVILPPGQSVETLVMEAIENGLRAKGYSVRSYDGIGSSIDVEITKFWLTYNIGAFSNATHLDVEIRLHGPIALGGYSQTVTEEFDVHGPLDLRMGRAAIDDGLDELSKKIQAVVRSP